jgi:hypothetical protein
MYSCFSFLLIAGLQKQLSAEGCKNLQTFYYSHVAFVILLQIQKLK